MGVVSSAFKEFISILHHFVEAFHLLIEVLELLIFAPYAGLEPFYGEVKVIVCSG